jgi:hypothetical protein
MKPSTRTHAKKQDDITPRGRAKPLKGALPMTEDTNAPGNNGDEHAAHFFRLLEGLGKHFDGTVGLPPNIKELEVGAGMTAAEVVELAYAIIDDGFLTSMDELRGADSEVHALVVKMGLKGFLEFKSFTEESIGMATNELVGLAQSTIDSHWITSMEGLEEADPMTHKLIVGMKLTGSLTFKEDLAKTYRNSSPPASRTNGNNGNGKGDESERPITADDLDDEGSRCLRILVECFKFGSPRPLVGAHRIPVDILEKKMREGGRDRGMEKCWRTMKASGMVEENANGSAVSIRPTATLGEGQEQLQYALTIANARQVEIDSTWASRFGNGR